jgi:hypothetical protein
MKAQTRKDYSISQKPIKMQSLTYIANTVLTEYILGLPNPEDARRKFTPCYPKDKYSLEGLNLYDITFRHVWREFQDKLIPRFSEHRGKL